MSRSVCPILEQGGLNIGCGHPPGRSDQGPHLASPNKPPATELDALQMPAPRPTTDRLRPKAHVRRGQDLGSFSQRDPVRLRARHAVLVRVGARRATRGRRRAGARRGCAGSARTLTALGRTARPSRTTALAGPPVPIRRSRALVSRSVHPTAILLRPPRPLEMNRGSRKELVHRPPAVGADPWPVRENAMEHFHAMSAGRTGVVVRWHEWLKISWGNY